MLEAHITLANLFVDPVCSIWYFADSQCGTLPSFLVQERERRGKVRAATRSVDVFERGTERCAVRGRCSTVRMHSGFATCSGISVCPPPDRLSGVSRFIRGYVKDPVGSSSEWTLGGRTSVIFFEKLCRWKEKDEENYQYWITSLIKDQEVKKPIYEPNVHDVAIENVKWMRNLVAKQQWLWNKLYITSCMFFSIR